MRRAMVVGMVVLCLTTPVGAGERQDARIEALEQENYTLVMEVNRLREQVRELQNRAAQERARRYPRRGSDRSGQRPLSEANRQLQDANQLKRNWDQFTR